MTTNRTLGLRRHAAPAAPVTPTAIYQDQVEYGLHRGLQRRRVIPAGNAPVVEDPVAEPVLEHIEAAVESEVIIEGVETATPSAAKPAPVAPRQGFSWTDGELIPDAGHYTARDGARFIDGVPAFLMEDRPLSNIR